MNPERSVPEGATIAQFREGGVYHVLQDDDSAACDRPGGGEMQPYTGCERLCLHCEAVVAAVVRERGTWFSEVSA